MQIFQNQQHKIIQADCIEALQTQVVDNSVDLIFADPPFGVVCFKVVFVVPCLANSVFCCSES